MVGASIPATPVKRFIGWAAMAYPTDSFDSSGMLRFRREGHSLLQLLVLRRCRSTLKICLLRGVHFWFGS
jgi:hypothetical protein